MLASGCVCTGMSACALVLKAYVAAKPDSCDALRRHLGQGSGEVFEVVRHWLQSALSPSRDLEFSDFARHGGVLPRRHEKKKKKSHSGPTPEIDIMKAGRLSALDSKDGSQLTLHVLSALGGRSSKSNKSSKGKR